MPMPYGQYGGYTGGNMPDPMAQPQSPSGGPGTSGGMDEARLRQQARVRARMRAFGGRPTQSGGFGERPPQSGGPSGTMPFPPTTVLPGGGGMGTAPVPGIGNPFNQGASGEANIVKPKPVYPTNQLDRGYTTNR